MSFFERTLPFHQQFAPYDVWGDILCSGFTFRKSLFDSKIVLYFENTNVSQIVNQNILKIKMSSKS